MTVIETEKCLSSLDYMNERRINKKLRKENLMTSNLAIYCMENQPILYFVTNYENVLDNSADCFSQLRQTGTYNLTSQELEKTKELSERFVIPELENDYHGLPNDSSPSIIEIDIDNMDQLNKNQLRLAELVYGSGNDLINNLTKVCKRSFEECVEDALTSCQTRHYPKILIHSSAYVGKNAKDFSLLRTCELSSFRPVGTYGERLANEVFNRTNSSFHATKTYFPRN